MIVEIMMEVVTVRWVSQGINKSMSEIKDKRKISGKLMWVFRSLWKTLASKYPKDK